MQSSSLPWWLLIIGLIVWFGSQDSPIPDPSPTPVVPVSQQTLPAFQVATNKELAKEHAAALAGICESLARIVEWDGQQPSPRIKTGVQIDDLRTSTREFRMQGLSFSQLYPQLGPIIHRMLTDQVGTSGGPLDPAQRARWVAAFRMLAADARWSAEQL